MIGEFCSDGHDWRRVANREWNTGNTLLDELNETAVFECAACPAKRWERQKRTAPLSAFLEGSA